VIALGTSGWQYKDWRGRFYPRDLPQKRWLEHYAGCFSTVEINNAFYRLPERDTFGAWRERAPDDFCYAVKMSRYLTHIKRLRDPEEPVQRFFGRAEALGPKLGPVLLQLPPSLRCDTGLLNAVLELMPKGTRVAVEPRHDSWWTDGVRAILERHDAALCWADRRSRPITPLWTTASWGYLRLHKLDYDQNALEEWAKLVMSQSWSEAYVYFKHDEGAGSGPPAVEAFVKAAMA